MKKSSPTRLTQRSGLTRRLCLVLCCGLGCVFAFGPVIHGLFHIGGLPHRHVAGSLHRHTDVKLSESAAAATDPGHRHRGHRHDAHSHGHPESQSDKGPAGIPAGEIPASENQSCPLFLLLEVDAVDSIAIDVEISGTTLQVYDVIPPRVSFSFAIEPGAASPRGPPIV